MKALRLKEDWRGLLAVLDELFQSAVGAVTGEGHREGEAALTELERLLCERRREERRVAGGVLGLAAEAFEALEDYDMASRCWMAAMRVDPCCVEVFQKLVIDARIQADSARQLLQSLQFSQDEEWVRDVFSDLIETVRISFSSFLSDGYERNFTNSFSPRHRHGK